MKHFPNGGPMPTHYTNHLHHLIPLLHLILGYHH